MSTTKKALEFWIGKDKVIIDEEMMPIVSMFTWHTKQCRKTKYVNTGIKIAGKKASLSLHRLLTGIKFGDVDHINRNGLDNRLSNLRHATRKQNSWNHVRKNSYGYRGVFKTNRSKSFSCQIQAHGKKYHKHGFKTAKDAAIAYDKESLRLHGEFGIRNFK